MAFVVARRGGRFEIRESVHTAAGPRARTLANFSVLTDAVLARAGERATRPFDASAVVRAAEHVRASVSAPAAQARRFVEASQRMAVALDRPASPGERQDPGRALAELLDLTDAIARTRPPRPFEPLGFPPLAPLAARRSTPPS